MRRAARLSAIALLIGGLVAPPAAAAPTGPPPHAAVGGFSAPTGDAFSLVFADGSVRPVSLRDAFALRLADRVTGGAPVPDGRGYWEVSADGNVFAYGTAVPFGGMGGAPLNAPVFAIAPTKSGNGYWLVARDGGVFSFGDAVFHGSAAALPLRQPIVGVATSPNGRGYRLVARDGGVFAFGKIAYAGSLPARHVHVTDVVGMASTPSGDGYWIARSDGHVDAFGDARPLGGTGVSACNRITGIISNPTAQGYRLVTDSGRTIPFGDAPGGMVATGTPRSCGHVTARIELPTTTIVAGGSTIGYLVVDNQTRAPLKLRSAGKCQPKWAIGLSSSAIPNSPIFTADCVFRPSVFPVGQSQRAFRFRASYAAPTGPCRCVQPLPPGPYSAQFFKTGGAFAPVAPATITVVAPG